jgi:hypothetical protein
MNILKRCESVWDGCFYVFSVKRKKPNLPTVFPDDLISANDSKWRHFFVLLPTKFVAPFIFFVNIERMTKLTGF